MLRKLELDHDGIAEILKGGDMAALVAEAAQGIASTVQSSGQTVDHDRYDIPVVVDSVITDRVHYSVTLAHPAGLAVQAKHGLLTAAAAAQGLEVTER